MNALMDMDFAHQTFLYYTHVRWLSKGDQMIIIMAILHGDVVSLVPTQGVILMEHLLLCCPGFLLQKFMIKNHHQKKQMHINNKCYISSIYVKIIPHLARHGGITPVKGQGHAIRVNIMWRYLADSW